MKTSKRKLIAYLMATSIFLSGCEGEFKGILNKDKNDLTTKDFTSSSSSEETEKINETEITEQTIPTTLEIETTSVTETSIIETEISPTEVVVETQPVTESTITFQEPLVEQSKDNIIVSATTNVNIRSSNTTESLKIGELKIYETAFKILSCDNNWDLVKYNNQIGYVCRDYLEYTNEMIEPEYTYQEYNDIVITKSQLNFRTAPTTDSEIILTFNKNTELQVVAKVDNDWLLVQNNGIFGYVHSDYTISLLDKANEAYPELNLTEFDIQKVVYPTTELNIRNGNNDDYERIGGLEQYESARVLGEYDNWYFVMTNEYNFGFISKNYTKELKDIFVIVDISKQRLYMYNNDVLCYIAPVTTGKDSTPSDIGLFKIWYKGTNEQITDTALVDYWMPYNSSYEGLHDAERWRSEFGITAEENEWKCYKRVGSNGCINMKLKDAKLIYENVSIGTKVLVHK